MTESFTLDEIYKKIDSSFKKTKIICTMGPKCTEHDILVSMLKKGMNIARLNFSHGDHESHGDTLQKVRAASKASGVPCAILLDTKGPEIRTGML
jgi:pyruvate kinase